MFKEPREDYLNENQNFNFQQSISQHTYRSEKNQIIRALPDFDPEHNPLLFAYMRSFNKKLLYLGNYANMEIKPLAMKNCK